MKGIQRLIFIALLATGLVTPGNAPAQSRKEQLVGAWSLVSINNTRVDGSRYELFGPDANGLLIFDTNGRYSLQIFRKARPTFAGALMEGTAEENKPFRE